MTNASSAIAVIQAMKVSLDTHKEKSIDLLMNSKGITRTEALLLIDEGKGNNTDFYNGWNIGSLHGYISALEDVLDSIK